MRNWRLHYRPRRVCQCFHPPFAEKLSNPLPEPDFLTGAGHASKAFLLLKDATKNSAPQWHIPEAIAAWIFPGLGHILLGEKRRGLILMVSIGSLWLTGLLIGGISVFDRVQHPIWFYVGQAFVAPSVAADITLQSLRGGSREDPPPDPPPPYEPSIGRINEQGLLFTNLTGLLNLLAILDVGYRDPRRRRHDSPGYSAAPESGAA